MMRFISLKQLHLSDFFFLGNHKKIHILLELVEHKSSLNIKNKNASIIHFKGKDERN